MIDLRIMWLQFKDELIKKWLHPIADVSHNATRAVV